MDYDAELKQLRKNYIEATPAQRLHIATQRIGNPGHGPNLLVTYVSAIEGLARSLVMHQSGRSKPELSSVYPRYRNKSAEDLISEYLKRRIKSDPASFFGREKWEKMKFAVEYRNVLVHECTYLGQDTYPDLIASCSQVLQQLAELEGLAFLPPRPPHDL